MTLYLATFFLVAIVNISLAQDNQNELKEVSKRFDDLQNATCSNKDKLTDEVIAEAKKCVCKDLDKVKEEEKQILKTCLKVDQLSDRQIVFAICEQKDCIVKGYLDKLAKESGQEIKKKNDDFDTWFKCWKSAAKIQ